MQRSNSKSGMQGISLALAGRVAATPSSQEGEGDAHVARVILSNKGIRLVFRATKASRAHFATRRRSHHSLGATESLRRRRVFMLDLVSYCFRQTPSLLLLFFEASNFSTHQRGDSVFRQTHLAGAHAESLRDLLHRPMF